MYANQILPSPPFQYSDSVPTSAHREYSRDVPSSRVQPIPIPWRKDSHPASSPRRNRYNDFNSDPEDSEESPWPSPPPSPGQYFPPSHPPRYGSPVFPQKALPSPANRVKPRGHEGRSTATEIYPRSSSAGRTNPALSAPARQTHHTSVARAARRLSSSAQLSSTLHGQKLVAKRKKAKAKYTLTVSSAFRRLTQLLQQTRAELNLLPLFPRALSQSELTTRIPSSEQSPI
ncbi:hypothetical protein K438DRAFT_417616 [Mycena galopus ATCC 62051]|nr:hypothetical protein K438DRAFT_417616 [Mycena galopus ATCC 62051]